MQELYRVDVHFEGSLREFLVRDAASADEARLKVFEFMEEQHKPLDKRARVYAYPIKFYDSGVADWE